MATKRVRSKEFPVEKRVDSHVVKKDTDDICFGRKVNPVIIFLVIAFLWIGFLFVPERDPPPLIPIESMDNRSVLLSTVLYYPCKYPLVNNIDNRIRNIIQEGKYEPMNATLYLGIDAKTFGHLKVSLELSFSPPIIRGDDWSERIYKSQMEYALALRGQSMYFEFYDPWGKSGISRYWQDRLSDHGQCQGSYVDSIKKTFYFRLRDNKGIVMEPRDMTELFTGDFDLTPNFIVTEGDNKFYMFHLKNAKPFELVYTTTPKQETSWSFTVPLEFSFEQKHFYSSDDDDDDESLY